MNKPKIGDLRIAVCEETQLEVVQQYVGAPDEWLCIHNDTDEEDAEEVKKLRQKEQDGE